MNLGWNGNLSIGVGAYGGGPASRLYVVGGSASNTTTNTQISGSTGTGLVVTDANNVGIGSTSPVVSLDISQRTDAIALPAGTITQRPGSPINGMLRYDSSGTPALEAYVNGAWETLITGTGSTSTITLGTSASATNPQRSGDATTGVFSPATGSVAVASGGTEEMRVNATGVGIGTTAPGSRLGLVNAAATQGTSGLNSAVTQTTVNTTDTADANAYFTYALTANSSASELVTRGVQISTDNHLTGGGAISNQRTLDLVQDTEAGTATTQQSALYIESNIAAGTVTNGYGITIASVQGTNKYGIYDASGANEYFGGLVGIGTTAPGANLHVYGGSPTFLITDSGQTAPAGQYLTYDSGDQLTVFRGLLGSTAVAKFQIANGQNATNSIGVQGISAGSFTGTNVTFFPTTGSSYINNGGNVGIGTTAPNATLQVSGASSSSTPQVVIGAASDPYVGIGASTSNYGWIQSYNTKPLFINPLGNNVILVTGGGNVGIGTASPTEVLTVNGNIQTAAGQSYITGGNNGAGGAGGYVDFTSNPAPTPNAGYGVWINSNAYYNGTNWIQPRGTLASTMFTSNYHFGWSFRTAAANGTNGATITPTEVVHFDTSGDGYFAGNVGIGTPSPTNKLTVVGGNIAAAGTGNTTGITLNNWNIYQDSSTNAYDIAYNAGTPFMNIVTSGNVGIGTASPNATLDVNGAILNECVTVSTLPSGHTGMRHCVTDATACAFMGSLTGGGSTVCPVFYNGSAWVGG